MLPPAEGRVYVVGRIAPILELGLGFHGELTGRENVMLQGALLGFSRAETRRRLDRIVEWAELQEFIDAPIRTFSTGMSARLAFAVATDVDPDILLVDEALSVGDEKFQRKCHDRMEGLRGARQDVHARLALALARSATTATASSGSTTGASSATATSRRVADAYHEWSLGETDVVAPAR